MTLVYRGRRIAFECDGDKCNEETTEWNKDEFDELKDEATSDGWEAYQDAQGNWMHFCKSCNDDLDVTHLN